VFGSAAITCRATVTSRASARPVGRPWSAPPARPPTPTGPAARTGARIRSTVRALNPNFARLSAVAWPGAGAAAVTPPRGKRPGQRSTPRPAAAYTHIRSLVCTRLETNLHGLTVTLPGLSWADARFDLVFEPPRRLQVGGSERGLRALTAGRPVAGARTTPSPCRLRRTHLPSSATLAGRAGDVLILR
jgi:hypothetical protein